VRSIDVGRLGAREWRLRAVLQAVHATLFVALLPLVEHRAADAVVAATRCGSPPRSGEGSPGGGWLLVAVLVWSHGLLFKDSCVTHVRQF
jgi:hypothetical protein